MAHIHGQREDRLYSNRSGRKAVICPHCGHLAHADAEFCVRCKGDLRVRRGTISHRQGDLRSDGARTRTKAR